MALADNGRCANDRFDRRHRLHCGCKDGQGALLPKTLNIG